MKANNRSKDSGLWLNGQQQGTDPLRGKVMALRMALAMMMGFSSLLLAQNNRNLPPPSTNAGPTSKSKVPFSKAQPEDITNENYPDLIESFDYPNADLAEVVKAISKLTGKNFILDRNVNGKITIIAPSQITVAEAYKAFLSALAMNGFTVVPSGKFLKIRQARAAQRDSIETYAGQYFPNTDQMITRIFKLKYINAEEVFKKLRMLVSKDGELNPYGPTNSLIMTDWGSNIERTLGILAQLDVPGFEEKLVVIRIIHAKAKAIADIINKIINKDSGEKSSVPRFRRSRTTDTGSGGSGNESYSLVVEDDRTNSIIVVGNLAGIQKIKRLVAKLDFPLRPEDGGGVQVYYVRNNEAEKVANVLNGIATEAKQSRTQGNNDSKGAPPTLTTPVFGGDVKVVADKVSNSLVITASKQDYQVVRSILAKIDIPRDQVFVKAVILEMNASDKFNWGINYYKFAADTGGVGRVGFSTGNITDFLDPTKDSGATIGFGSGDKVTINNPAGGAAVEVTSLAGLIKFVKTNLNANILSTPQLMTMNNEEGSIEVGQTIPVAQNQNATAAGTQTSVQREKATIKLQITPYISPDSTMVRMKIEQQVKQLSNQQVPAAALADTAVVTNDREIKTMISVESGDTAVLGGLIRDQEEENETKIPILGDIPIIGWLFKTRGIDKTKQNLMVFITPRIIRNLQESSDLLNQKLNERLTFIQTNFSGRDPHGFEIDNLPRKAFNEDAPAEIEEPASETF